MSGKIALLLIAISLLLLLERLRPLREPRHAVTQRWGINLLFSLLTYGTAFLLVQPAIESALSLSAEYRFGLIRFLQLGLIPEIFLAWFALDFTFYLWHRANHQIPFLWRFHRIHHADPDLDVTTAFRFHFAEVALSSGFRFLQIFLLGIKPWWMLAGFEIAFQLSTFFHHSNVKLPAVLEKILSTVWVTPRLHGLHHSIRTEDTHSNYSVIFSFWDRWMGTFTPAFPEHEVTIGLPDAPATPNVLPTLLLEPFTLRGSGRPLESDENNRPSSP